MIDIDKSINFYFCKIYRFLRVRIQSLQKLIILYDIFCNHIHMGFKEGCIYAGFKYIDRGF